jgi:hypothetical protein
VFAAEGRQIGNHHPLPVRADEACVGLQCTPPAASVSPAAMATDSAVSDSHHMSGVQPMLAAESGQIGDRAYRLSVRGNETFPSLDVFSFAGTIFVSPAFVRSESAFAVREDAHSSVVQPFSLTELVQVKDGDFVAVGINEAFPHVGEFLSRRTGNGVDVESNAPVCAASSVEPFLLHVQKLIPARKLQNREDELILAVLMPRLL